MDDWPPYSPDMNLIENLWAHLKLELPRRYPDTTTLYGLPQYIRQRITERVHEVWWSIGEEVLDRLLDSMPDRMHELIKARGWYTRYRMLYVCIIARMNDASTLRILCPKNSVSGEDFELGQDFW